MKLVQTHGFFSLTATTKSYCWILKLPHALSFDSSHLGISSPNSHLGSHFQSPQPLPPHQPSVSSVLVIWRKDCTCQLKLLSFVYIYNSLISYCIMSRDLTCIQNHWNIIFRFDSMDMSWVVSLIYLCRNTMSCIQTHDIFFWLLLNLMLMKTYMFSWSWILVTA